MIVLQNMGGIAPKITPELLPDNMAQVANNAILHRGGVAPLKTPVTVATPSKSGVKKSIYRFGVAQPEGQYWFSWTTPVNVARGPIAGDTTLGTELGRAALTSSTPSGAVATYIATFGAGIATGAVTEAGIFNAASNGTMLARTVFPVVNKGADDGMSITW